MKRWLVRAALIAVVAEIFYLGSVNLAMNLPLTQTLINKARPEKFAVYWDRAWSWYPFRVNARGISANGQSPSQQWQVDTPAASGSISLLPLFKRAVDIHHVTARDIVYYQRPRPRPDKKFSALREFFPDIRDRKREDAPPAQAPKMKRKPWIINLTHAHARGNHRIWIYQAQGSFRGKLHTDLEFQAPGGPLSLSNGGVDLELDSLVVNGNQLAAGQGNLKGIVEMAPFVPLENKGVKALAFLKAGVDIGIETESLAFLNLYLSGFHGMKVDGAGKLNGHIAVENGKLQPETDLEVSARELFMKLLSHRVEGAGTINLYVRPDTADTAQVVIEFSTLQGFPADSQAPLLSGKGLSVAGRGDTTFVPLDKRDLTVSDLSIDIPSVQAPDIGRFQRYLPPHIALKLHSGQGELQGRAVFTDMGFDAQVKLVSEDTDLEFKDYRFNTKLDMAIKADCPSIGAAGIDISGTYLRLNKAELSRRQQKRSTPWYAMLTVEKGVLKIDLPEDLPKDADPGQRWAALKGKVLAPLLGTEETLAISGRISDLRWLNLLFKNPYDLTVDGEGEMSASVNIEAGWLAPGTTLQVLPQELTVNVLDYVATGDGRVELEVEKGGEHPDISLQVKVDKALFKRRDDKKAFIEDVVIELEAIGRGMGYGKPGDDVALDLRILSATVKDMSVYNRYLPPQSPFAFLGGKADLVADISLTPTSASGFVKLKTTGMQSRIDEQEISGELTADITLAGGVPENMDFDISGSTLVLDEVRITGKRKTFEQADWHARLDLKTGRAVWKKPTRVEVQADFELSDTRPLVEIISNNQGGKLDWLENLLTIEDIRGEARMKMVQDQIVIPYAFAGSEKIDVGAKGIISAQTRDGVFYARFKKLHALLKIKNEDRHLDIYHARQKFDRYSPEKGKLK